jgi:AraC-like DNA-binding protein
MTIRADERAEYAEVGGANGIALIVAEFSRHSYVPHWHESYALGVVEGGAARTLHCGREYVAPAGAVMCVNPREVHTGEPLSPSSGGRYRMLYPSIALMQQLAVELHLGSAAPVLFRAPVIHDPELARMVVAACDCLEGRSVDSTVAAALRAVLARLIARHRAPFARAELRREHSAVLAAQQYMVSHLRDRVTLDDLAAHVALSPFYLTRLFSASTGMAPYTWLEHARVRHAGELLRSGVRISDVAHDTGFSDQAHLTRRFKRVVGIPPGQFVRAVRKPVAVPEGCPDAPFDRAKSY